MTADEILLAALEKPTPAERAAYLDGACGPDAALRALVQGLLKAHEAAGSFLEQPLFESTPTSDQLPSSEKSGTVIGPYKLLEQIGEGGFGVVFMAEQQQPLRRRVALKVIKPGMDTKQVVARFEAERQALAMMDHQNIARVLEAGATDSGRPYFVMELVRGIPITQFCDDNRLTLPERLELFVAVCQAVQHAHQKGIIHRDLKPNNVLVTLHDGTPLVKVIDFGIAKALGQQRLTDKTLVTGFAQMIGTPLYMSPEQAEMSGQDADTRTDIYALGVLLYELLTGTTPFDKERLKEANYEEIRRIIREEEPAKPSTRISTLGQAATTVSANRKSEPRRLSQLFRGELDWIVMKALEKDCNRRYETASSFAADVQRYLHDEPVQACPPSAVYRFHKFARRNKAALMTASAVAFAMLLAVTGLVASNILVLREKAQTEAAKDELQQTLRRERQNSYYERIALADREWSANNLGRMQQLLQECPAELRSWEWHYLKRLQYTSLPPLRHDSTLVCLAFSPDSQCLASGGEDGVINLWDAHTGQRLRIFRARTGKPMENRSVAFSPDGQRLAAGYSDGRIRIWDVRGDQEPLDWEAHRGTVICLVFSPEGKRLASCCFSRGLEGELAGGEAKVWDAATGKEIFTFRGQPQGMLSLAFSPDGRRIASGGEDKTVKVWDARSGQEVWTSREQRAPVRTVAFSPDGRSLASAEADYSGLSDAEVKLWDAQTGEPRRTLRGHIGYLHSIAFSPDGQRLASAGLDRTVKLWDVATGRVTLTLRDHKLVIWAVAFSPDGRQLASASRDRTVRIWDATPLEEKPGEEPLTLPVNPDGGVLGVAFHPDNQWLATVADDVKLWDRHTGKKLFTLPHSEGCWCIAFSPDGQRLAGGKKGEVKVWEVRTGQLFHSLGRFSNATSRVAFSPDSRRLVSTHFDRNVRVWDMSTGDGEVRIPAAHAGPILGLALSPDGKSIVTSGLLDERVKVWDAATRRPICALEPPHAGPPWGIAFRSDGKLLASASGDSASGDGTIKLWDTESWKQQGEDLRNPGGILPKSLAFSPDGRLLAWGSMDSTVIVWQALTKEIQTLRSHTSWVKSVAFSPDGEWIASASQDGTVKIWKTPPLAE
jgi:WD40 repeat protein/serine/threonine protein kinase